MALHLFYAGRDWTLTEHARADTVIRLTRTATGNKGGEGWLTLATTEGPLTIRYSPTIALALQETDD